MLKLFTMNFDILSSSSYETLSKCGTEKKVFTFLEGKKCKLNYECLGT
jgi:hypothetical protein